MNKLLLIFLLAVTLGCPRKPGDPCELGEEECTSDTLALVCEDGRLHEVDCNGPQRCRPLIEGFVFCDNTRARGGDTCRPSEEGQTQCYRANANEMLACRLGTWMEEPCKGCVKEGAEVVCQP